MKSVFGIRKSHLLGLLTILITLPAFMNKAYCQAEVEPWGNITGIRKKGQLFELESSLRIISADGLHEAATAKEKQKPHYKRNGDEQEITTNIDSLFIKETIKDQSSGKIKVTLNLTAHADTTLKGVYLCLRLPHGNYSNGQVRLSGSNTANNFVSAEKNYEATATGIEFVSPMRQLKITFDDPAMVMIRRDTAVDKSGVLIYIALKLIGLHKGETIKKTYNIKASGFIDETPVNLALSTSAHGRQFDGLGGNFRLQNPATDQQVIDYCLETMRVAWGRVELPWRFWQPNKDVDPTATADSGKLHPAVKKAMLMAHRLDSLGMPLVLTAWFPPNWAITGKLNMRPVKGVWGNPLNKDNITAIYKSIGDYIRYLKTEYGTEVKLFSFNESDLGINVRLTPEDHDEFIKGCGAYFAEHGIGTKMLLGDNSDATTYKFIYPALNDPDAVPYIGAISFHSWRGWDSATLQKWADAATTLNVPLLIGEGSIDAAAYSYPDIFQEPTYALQEINLYMRLLSICQPLSILQWQLTADYSPLIGGGIFGNNKPLHPGQRFWNLDQLSMTPKGLYYMPISCDRANVSAAALGDNAKNSYTVHLVNNGTTRMVTLTGLPAAVKTLLVYNTSKKDNMEQGKSLKVINGQVNFKMQATSFTTLISQ